MSFIPSGTNRVKPIIFVADKLVNFPIYYNSLPVDFLVFVAAKAHNGYEKLIRNEMMNARPYALLTVRVPPDLQSALEEISIAKGESVSTIVRSALRAVAANARQVDSASVVAREGLLRESLRALK